jgi:GTP-binding protein
MDQSKIRNIAIIAHVDHGKTTLVDQLFKQSGMFRENQVIEERLMDSMDLERERGITITSKNGSFNYKDCTINIVDTPGHADFSGQVERILNMVDGALLLVDAAEGPMPQTYYVLKKALQLQLPIVIVINKIDKPASRVEWVYEQVLELFIKLNANEEFFDYPVIYASAVNGYAMKDPNATATNMVDLYDTIIDFLPAPKGNQDDPLQLLVSSIDYSQFLGRLGIGKLTSGTLTINQEVLLMSGTGENRQSRISKIYRFERNEMVPIEQAITGEIIAVAGMEDIGIGETITDVNSPMPLPSIQIDPPTISMSFIPNDSPFAGQDGKFVTSRHLHDRLYRETLSDVALLVEPLVNTVGYKVSGRGELHLSILIEKMRREGYEFQISRPEVIYKTENGKRLEPYEELTIDVDEEYMGRVIEMLGNRKGSMVEMHQDNGVARLIYQIPTRGLLGFRSELLTETRGNGIMNYLFDGFQEYAGDMINRVNGVLISKDTCTTVAYALFNLQERGKLFYGPQVKVYEGQIVGENSRVNDLEVNPGKTKKLTNIRAAGSDENIILTPPTEMSLENCISYINDDELIEITPLAIRLRKRVLRVSDRKRLKNASKQA